MRAQTGVASNSAPTLKLTLAFYYIFRAGKTALLFYFHAPQNFLLYEVNPPSCCTLVII
jgi:hypothetical protein